MLSRLNGEENYFTRICVGGLLNTRKLELAHLLLQDINMFHLHPIQMPNSSSDLNRCISAAVSHLTSSDRKSRTHSSLTNDPLKASIPNVSTLLTPLGNNNSPNGNNVGSSSNSNNKIGNIKNTVSLGKINTGSQQQSEELTTPSSYEEDVAGLNDLASFITYASCKPNQTYMPIREDNPMLSMNVQDIIRVKHNVSYIKLDDNPKLDHSSLQALQNGFTFVCFFNESEPMQSNYLLNIRLESDNSTLIWSKPAWDIKNVWLSQLSNPTLQTTKNEPVNSLNAENSVNSETPTNLNQSSISSSTILGKPVSRFRKNRPPLLSAATTLSSNTGQSFIKKTLLTQFNSKTLTRQYNKTKSRSFTNRRKSALLTSKNQELANLISNYNAKNPNEIFNSNQTNGFNNNYNNIKSSSSTLNEADDLIFDPVDPNIIYSVSSLTKRYVLSEPVSFNDPYEGYLDLHSVKHISKGCLDAQLFSNIKQVASTYAFDDFDQANIICLVYGNAFSENK